MTNSKINRKSVIKQIIVIVRGVIKQRTRGIKEITIPISRDKITDMLCLTTLASSSKSKTGNFRFIYKPKIDRLRVISIGIMNKNKK